MLFWAILGPCFGHVLAISIAWMHILPENAYLSQTSLSTRQDSWLIFPRKYYHFTGLLGNFGISPNLATSSALNPLIFPSLSHKTHYLPWNSLSFPKTAKKSSFSNSPPPRTRKETRPKVYSWP